MITVCLPDAEALRLAAPLPDEVRAITWNGFDHAPENIQETRFVAATFGQPYAAMFAAMPQLEVVQTLSAGIDDLLGQVPGGVILCDARGVHGGSVSEWVLTAILASVRGFPRFLRAQERHEWDRQTMPGLVDKRVLVIGAGDLGEQTARRLRAFDATPTMVARHARAGVHAIEEVHDLLPHADIVVLLVPITDETRGLVDKRFLAAMPDGALLVNAARGPVVVTNDLLAELNSGRLGAALDVTDPEPLPPEHPLWDAPNLLLTPHVGGNVTAFPTRAYALVRDQITRFVSHEPLINVVDGVY